MEQRITHACGHEQVHYLAGFASQQDRKAQWLATTSCRNCFVAQKRAGEAAAAVRDGEAVAHLSLATLVGSDRQIGWATSIRASRLAALAADQDRGFEACLTVTDAKWWIDTRSLKDADLLAKAQPLATS